MNLKNLIAAVAILSSAGAVLADGSLPYTEYRKFESARDRADVVAEIDPAAAGQSTANNEYHRFTTAGSNLTRADVRAGLERDFAAGRNTDLRNPEFAEYKKFASTKTRDQARGESFRSATGISRVNITSGS